MSIKVVQWTTGNVGQRSVRGILKHPDLELTGCFAWSPNKTGKDVGELCGIEPTGVLATNDVDALLASKPDCVAYNPMHPDVDEMVRILEAGVNISTTALFVTGHKFGAERERIAAACERGSSSIFGSGINPAWVDLLAIALANGCDHIEKISITESADISGYDSPETELPVGFARPIDDPALPQMTHDGTAVFEDAVRLIGDALGVEFDEVRCDAVYAQTTEDVDLGSWSIPAGCVAGIDATWKGIVNGQSLVESRVQWRKGRTLEPDWQLEQGYRIEVTGSPTLKAKIDVRPSPGFRAESFQDYMMFAMTLTAMPAVFAIPYVVAASPGIVTYADLPLPMPRGVASV